MLPPFTIGMQPMPIAETSRPWPSLRYFMALLPSCAFLEQAVLAGVGGRLVEPGAAGDRDRRGHVHADIAERAHQVRQHLDRDQQAERLDRNAHRQADR